MDAGLDDEEIVELKRQPGIITGDQELVHLLARADSDDLLLASGRDRFRQIDDAHRRNLRHENLPAGDQIEAAADESRAIVKTDPEARHARIGDRIFLFSRHCWKNGTTLPREPSTLP